MERGTVYEAVGGDRVFEAIAAAHHARCLADPVLEHPFSHGVRPDHVERLAAYWAEVLGGPAEYSSRFGDHPAVMTIHAGQGMEADLGDRFVACFVAALDDAGVPPDPELRACLRAYMRWAVDQMYRYNTPDAVVPADLPMPRWSWSGLVAD